jgi:3-oxoacyl-[acyl-carrier-protein] synthase-1
MSQPLYVTCLGLTCPVGLDPVAAAAAMRCAITGFAELHYTDTTGQPVVGAAVPGLGPNLRGHFRLVELLSMAVAGIEDRLSPDLKLGELPVLLCTCVPESGVRLKGLVGEVESRLGLSFRRADSSHVARGHVAVFEALGHARRLLAGGYATACLIIAVDTLIDARALLILDQAKRLKTAIESDGVIPGEAAGVLLVTRRPRDGVQLHVRGIGFSEESATVLNEEPLLGKGMAAAIRQALAEAGAGMHDIDFRLADAAGESYAFEELVLGRTRVMRTNRERQDLWQPAGSTGDCGAAAGLVQLAWAEQAFARGYAPGALAMAHCAATSGTRAVAVLEGGGTGHVA